jgi:hypothetical protein
LAIVAALTDAPKVRVIPELHRIAFVRLTMIANRAGGIGIGSSAYPATEPTSKDVPKQDLLTEVTPTLGFIPRAPLMGRIPVLKALLFLLDAGLLKTLRQRRDERLQHDKA